MVMRIQRTEPKQRFENQGKEGDRIAHSGQDPHVIHGRVRSQNRRCQVESFYIQQKIKLESTYSISIDEYLLTGNLEEDISILSIVA